MWRASQFFACPMIIDNSNIRLECYFRLFRWFLLSKGIRTIPCDLSPRAASTCSVLVYPVWRCWRRSCFLMAPRDGGDPDPPPVDINTMVLPDPSDNFDPGSPVLVDLDTFTSDANSLTMEVSDFVLPGGVDAMDDGDQGDLIGRMNDQRNDLLKEVDDQIAKTQKVKNTLNGIKSIILGNIADNQTELGTLGNSLQDAAKRNLLNQAIYYERHRLSSVMLSSANSTARSSFLMISR